MTDTAAYDPGLGAIIDGDGVRFRVWAPAASRVDVRVSPAAGDEQVLPLASEAHGYFSAVVPGVGAGTRYEYVLDGGPAYPDPASRSQPDGVKGASAVVDASTFRWTDEAWAGLAPEDVVRYELHVGTFTPAGTYAATAEALPRLVGLGVTAVQLLPLSDFPGERGWGYDGVQPFAATRAYGTPDDLRALVDRAHGLGLAVILDVVYNHFGPDGAYQGTYSPQYFNDRHQTPWGAAINLDGPGATEVRRYFIESALHWLHEYHFDGFRLDATNALIDDSPRHFLAEFAERVRAGARPGQRPLLTAEDSRNLDTILRTPEAGGYDFDEVLADDFHHELRRLLAGDHEGYYADYRGSTDDAALALQQGWIYTGRFSQHWGHARGSDSTGIPLTRFGHCLQNHDQVGNRALGERLHHDVPLEAYRAASALLLCSATTPMLFMGQEWAASSPFLFFSDHNDELGQLVTEGRRAEFRAWSSFAGPAARERIPDPQAIETFERSRLDWAEREREPHASMLRYYAALIRLRRTAPALRWTPAARQHAAALDARTIELSRAHEDDAVVVVARLIGDGPLTLNLGGGVDAPRGRRWEVALTSEDAEYAADAVPIEVRVTGEAATLHFQRPGAVVFRLAS